MTLEIYSQLGSLLDKITTFQSHEGVLPFYGPLPEPITIQLDNHRRAILEKLKESVKVQRTFLIKQMGKAFGLDNVYLDKPISTLITSDLEEDIRTLTRYILISLDPYAKNPLLEKGAGIAYPNNLDSPLMVLQNVRTLYEY